MAAKMAASHQLSCMPPPSLIFQCPLRQYDELGRASGFIASRHGLPSLEVPSFLTSDQRLGTLGVHTSVAGSLMHGGGGPGANQDYCTAAAATNHVASSYQSMYFTNAVRQQMLMIPSDFTSNDVTRSNDVI